tara:strand:- start:33669 stop:34076 length:408 start_codon:yes stop_codon:yes gene_type:complete
MREQDVREVAASHGHAPYEALQFSVKNSQFSTVASISGEPFCVFGLSTGESAITHVGSPWMLGTKKVSVYRRPFLRASFDVVEDMLKESDLLVNHVHVENHVSIKWLRALGFTIESPVEYGINKELFHQFHLRKT